MSNKKNIKFNIPIDNEGFITLNCPHCNFAFKLEFSIANDENVIILYCPSCGLSSYPNNFIPLKILKHAETLISNEMKNILNDFTDNLEKTFKKNKYVSFKKNKNFKIEIPEPLFETNHELETLELNCCNSKVKALKANILTGIYCPYCGVKSDGV